MKAPFLTLALAGFAMGSSSALASEAAKEDQQATSQPPSTADEGGGLDSVKSRKRAAEILRQMLPPAMANSMSSDRTQTGFGKEMSRISYENAYVQLWARPGLTPKERSMITIAMLIALGSEYELKVHVAGGYRNGLTREQLEEIIYHSSAYVGFPRASTALAIATEAMATVERKKDTNEGAK